MKQRLTYCLLAAALLLGTLSGCTSETQAELTTGEALAGQGIELTLESVSLGAQITAPFTTSETGAVSAYYADVSDASYQYADCTATVRNTGSAPFDPNELDFYCTAGSKTYEDFLLLYETQDGTALEKPGMFDAGDTARIHYAVVLPEDVDAETLSVCLRLPQEETVYTAPLSALEPHATDIQVDDCVSSEIGASLTISQVSISDTVVFTSANNAKRTLTSSAEGNRLVNISIEVRNLTDEPLTIGTLFAGEMYNGTSHVNGVVLGEDAGTAYSYNTPVQPDASLVAHLLFDVPQEQIEGGTFYLYFDGAYYALHITPGETNEESDDAAADASIQAEFKDE